MRRKVLVMIKNSLLAFFAVCAITSPAEGKDGFSTEKRAQLMLQYTGGMVTNAAKGMIVIYDTQAKWDHAEISREASAFLGGFRLPYTIQRETPAQVHSMYDLLVRSGANAGVFIVNDRTLPAILTSPDSAFAVLNVASCESKGINLSTGIRQALILALGGVYSPSETEQDFQPELIMGMIAHLPKLGITPWKEATYRQACHQGWAPLPKSDYQKAIWDEVHSVPSKPIKITYDKDKQKPVVK